MKRLWIIACILLFVCGCSSFHQTHPMKPDSVESEENANHPESRLILRHDDREWTLDLGEIGFDGVDPTTLDRTAFFRWLATVEQEVNRPPVSAHFRNRVLQPHQNGRKLDRAIVENWLDNIHAYVNRPLDIPFQVWRPPLTTAMLERIREKRMSTYTTRFNPNNRNRTHNIELSVQAIDHHVVPVGDVFSFNRVVGQRTPDRGYRPAPVIVKGEYTEGIGGGICQTSSTLFNSVDRAGLRIIQRVSHSKEVTYVPVGRDATVSWSGPDFQFQNQLNRPILLVAAAINGQLTVEVYASSDITYTPKPVPNPPTETPDTHRVPSPSRRQPLDRATRYEHPPLPPDQLDGNWLEEEGERAG